MANTSLRSFLRPLGWFFLFNSALVALGGAWLIFSSVHLGDDTRTAQGRVVAHQTAKLKLSIGQHSVVEFNLPDGRTMRIVDSLVRQGGAVHKIGEVVTVSYPVADPMQAQITSSNLVQIFLGVGMLFMSTIGIVIGWLLLRFNPKATSSAAPH